MSVSNDKKSIILNNGKQMPILGIGTWRADSEEELENALSAAFDAGYRHVDCAHVYGNEAVIGRAIKKLLDSNKVKREELFIVTKLPFYGNRPSSVEKYLKEQLKSLQVDYLDLYLIHTPFGIPEFKGDGPPTDENGEIVMEKDTDHVAIWKEMEKFVDQGLIKAIGISNFNKKQVQNVIDHARIKPACLQIEMHVYLQQRELVEFCKNNNIAVVAYSPLGSRGISNIYKNSGHDRDIPDLLDIPEIQEIAKHHGKTAAQILLKWILENGVATIPKSVNPNRLKQNLDLFDFSLTKEELDTIAKLDKGIRICDFSFFKGLKVEQIDDLSLPGKGFQNRLVDHFFVHEDSFR